MSYLNSRNCRITVAVLGVITILIPVIYSFWAGIDVDSAVILSEMERISEGYIPYKTIHLNYPPLFFYICVAFKWLFHIPYGCYPCYLALHYSFVFASAFFVYGISRKFNGSITVSLFCVWLFLMITQWTQGNYVLFEIPSISLGMAAMFFSLLKKDGRPYNFIWIGTLASCSFLIKQFGAGFGVLGLYLIFVFCREGKCKKILSYIIGYSIPITICVLLFGRHFIDSVLFNGYGTETASLAGFDTSIVAKYHQITDNLFLFCYRTCPIVFAAVVSIYFIVKYNLTREFFFCVFGILGFALSFWFVQGGLHYTLYMTPFAVLMTPLLFQSNCKNPVASVSYLMVVLTMLLALYSTYHNRVCKGLKNSQLRSQNEMSIRLSSLIEHGKTVWIVHGGIEYLYWFNNLVPPNMESVGYATGPLEVTKEKQWKQVKDADYVIHFTKDYPYDYSFDEEIRSFVNQFPSDTLDEYGSIVIHRMK